MISEGKNNLYEWIYRDALKLIEMLLNMNWYLDETKKLHKVFII